MVRDGRVDGDGSAGRRFASGSKDHEKNVCGGGLVYCTGHVLVWYTRTNPGVILQYKNT